MVSRATHEAIYECGNDEHEAYIIDFVIVDGRAVPLEPLLCGECVGSRRDRQLFPVSNLRRK